MPDGQYLGVNWHMQQIRTCDITHCTPTAVRMQVTWGVVQQSGWHGGHACPGGLGWVTSSTTLFFRMKIHFLNFPKQHHVSKIFNVSFNGAHQFYTMDTVCDAN
jgi:hypothetical protein